MKFILEILWFSMYMMLGMFNKFPYGLFVGLQAVLLASIFAGLGWYVLYFIPVYLLFEWLIYRKNSSPQNILAVCSAFAFALFLCSIYLENITFFVAAAFFVAPWAYKSYKEFRKEHKAGIMTPVGKCM